MKPTDEIGPHRLYLGDSVSLLRGLPDCEADAVITDPPYSSGGMMRGDRAQSVADKYVQSGAAKFENSDFSGDNRDQRSWAYWCHMWLSECLRVTKPGGYLLVFTDWRQLPTTTDVIQSAGWVWRGILSWDKGPGSRAPTPRYFRHQCEYLVWGTRGPMSDDTSWPPEGRGCYPGSYTCPVRQDDKHHMVGKPTTLMRQLVFCVPPGARVLDPFSGSGTTGVACAEEGRHFSGIETCDDHYETMYNRVAKAVREQPERLY